MPLTAWPPLTAPSWPPPGYTILEAYTIDHALEVIEDLGWSWRNPTQAENNEFFDAARCERGHRVDGVMVIDARAGGLAYPFARCRGPERTGMALWYPYDIGHVE